LRWQDNSIGQADTEVDFYLLPKIATIAQQRNVG